MRPGNIGTDGQRTRRTLFRSIRTKLIVNFILVFVAILVIVEWIETMGVPFTPYSGRWGEQRAEAFRSLNLIADLKKERLLRWMEERRDDTHVTAANEFIAANVVQLRMAIREFAAEGREEAELWDLVREEGAYRTFVKYLDTVRDTYEVYDRIQVVDAETGKIFVSTDDEDLGADASSHRTCFSETLKTRALYVSDIKMEPQIQRPTLHFSDIIKDQEGEVVAVLIMEVRVDDIITPMLHTGEGLGERGEALLVNKDVKILTSLKHPLADGSIAEPLEYQITDKPAVLAANGEEGIIESEDYRGEPVLAAYRYIRVSSEWGWGMVVKRDKAELFAPLRRDITDTLFFGLGGIFAIIGLTIVIASNLTRPMLSLSRIANQVAEGNLDARVPVATSDEVGTLATTFNSMVQRIQNWREELEEQVQTRTAELRALNEDLTKEIAVRKRTEEALAEERNLLRTIIDNLPDYIYAKDTESRYLVSNIAHVRFLGATTSDEIVGKTVFELFPQELAAQYHANDQEIIRLGQPLLNREERSVDRTGNSIWNLTTKVPLRDSHRKIIGLVGIARDITERKRAEEEREALIEELEAKNAELERFTYTVSHDLKSPLITIKGFLGLLEQDATVGDTERMKFDMHRISNAADKMRQLLDELLELSRIGRLVNPPEEIPFGELAREALDMIAGRLAERGVKVEIAPDLPVVYGDRLRLREVLTNLMDNAVKFMGDQPAPRVEIGTRRDGEETVFYVRDNGVGIELQYHEKVFGLFDKLDKQTEGTGVGLAIVKRIVEVHGGRIWVESEGVGQGSTFCFTLLDK